MSDINKFMNILKIIMETESINFLLDNPEVDLREHGLTSIKFIQLSTLIEEAYGIVFSDLDLLFDSFCSVSKIMTMLSKYEVILN
ncbi:acyl carrier protein [Fontibacillus solani]|uniref:Acyl carrier protein n=1 Tax=Fontibacillus solani TaxID=1572857 RepID=A0A7W3XQX1_9BACL|nr:acyl carrier protein [Fontibacillus solani]